MHDAQLGRIFFVAVTAGFAYLSLWLLAAPFIDDGHFAQRLFPPVTLAYAPFCLAGVVLLSVVLGYVGVLFIQEGLQGQKETLSTD